MANHKKDKKIEINAVSKPEKKDSWFNRPSELPAICSFNLPPKLHHRLVAAAGHADMTGKYIVELLIKHFNEKDNVENSGSL